MKITGSKRHSFVCADTDRHRLLWFDADGHLTRQHRPEGVCFDVWSLPDHRTLYTHYGLGSDGITAIGPHNQMLFHYEMNPGGEIFSCQPLANGHILLGEVQSCCITELDAEGRIAARIPIRYTGRSPHEAMRTVRCRDGLFYIVQPGDCAIRVYNAAGHCLHCYPTYPDPFGLILLSDENLLYSHRQGVVKLDQTGQAVWELTPRDVPEAHICWLLGMQLLSDGNLVLANWLGHGQHGKGLPLFEITPQKDIVWTCDCTDLAAEPAAFQVLEEDASLVCFTPTR